MRSFKVAFFVLFTLAAGAASAQVPSPIAADTHSPARNELYIKEDFIITSVSITDFGMTSALANAGTIAFGTSVVNHPGVLALGTGVTADGRSVLTTDPTLILLSGAATLDCVYRIPVLSDATDTFHVNCGIDTISGAITDPAANGVYVRYSSDVNGGAFEGIACAASSCTRRNLTVTPVANTWYRVGYTINQALNSVQFFVDGVAQGAPVTTNIPTVGMGVDVRIDRDAGSSNARNVQVDFFEFRMGLTR